MVRTDLIQRMANARGLFEAAIRDVDAVLADRPLAPGKWSIRAHALHLHAWDLLALEALEPAARGVEPTWANFGRDQTDRLNESCLAPLRATDWSAARERLASGRRSLIQAVEALTERAEMWSEGHALGAMLLDLAWNDAHHAEITRRGLANIENRRSRP